MSLTQEPITWVDGRGDSQTSLPEASVLSVKKMRMDQLRKQFNQLFSGQGKEAAELPG